MTVVVMQAQSLDGKWTTTIDDDGTAIKSNMTFSGKTVLLDFYTEQSSEEFGTIGMKFSIPGTYTRSGSTVEINFDKDKANFEIVKTEFSQAMKDELKEEPDLEDMLKELFKGLMEEEGKAIAEALPLSGEVTITTLTATKLVLSSGEDNMVFTRVK